MLSCFFQEECRKVDACNLHTLLCQWNRVASWAATEVENLLRLGLTQSQDAVDVLERATKRVCREHDLVAVAPELVVLIPRNHLVSPRKVERNPHPSVVRRLGWQHRTIRSL